MHQKREPYGSLFQFDKLIPGSLGLAFLTLLVNKQLGRV